MHFQPPILARGDIFPLNAAREPFFVKMQPAYETEFETPVVYAVSFSVLEDFFAIEFEKYRSDNLDKYVIIVQDIKEIIYQIILSRNFNSQTVSPRVVLKVKT